MFGWSGADQFPCSIYLSRQIPNEKNSWIGTNVGGYQSKDYDRLCGAASVSNLFSPEKRDEQWAVQQIYAADLPVIPLYFNFSIAVSNINTCGIRNESGTRSLLWNLESLSFSEESCAVSQWNNIYANYTEWRLRRLGLFPSSIVTPKTETNWNSSTDPWKNADTD